MEGSYEARAAAAAETQKLPPIESLEQQAASAETVKDLNENLTEEQKAFLQHGSERNQ